MATPKPGHRYVSGPNKGKVYAGQINGRAHIVSPDEWKRINEGGLAPSDRRSPSGRNRIIRDQHLGGTPAAAVDKDGRPVATSTNPRQQQTRQQPNQPKPSKTPLDAKPKPPAAKPTAASVSKPSSTHPLQQLGSSIRHRVGQAINNQVQLAGDVNRGFAEAPKGTNPLKVIGDIGSAVKGPIALGVTGGSLLSGLLIGNRNARDAQAKAKRQKNLDKTLPEMTPEQIAAAVRLGQAQPEDVGNKTKGTAAAAKAPPAPQLPPPTIGAPVHSGPQAFGSGVRQPVGRPTVGRPSVGSTSTSAALSSETYRDGGKGLYQGTKAYRDAVGGSGNPLLNRLRADLGLDTATGNRPDKPKSSEPAAAAVAPLKNEEKLIDKLRKKRRGAGYSDLNEIA
jgi:hypothetical protein